DSVSSAAMQSVFDLVFANNEQEFRHTLKRCCYILVNNWDATRHFKPIQDLVQIFSDPACKNLTNSTTLKRVRIWINNFVQSKDFEELRLFASRYDRGSGPWASRYTSYLLVPQYTNHNNPIEQREAARALSRQLKDRFKFDLAMYIAKSQSSSGIESPPNNPTALGDQVLRLIKVIVAKKGPFSYFNLANIFINQTQNIDYRQFKRSLQTYLMFSVVNQTFAETLKTKLQSKLEELYVSHHDDLITDALILRTCNRVIDYLTTENQVEPSPLFILLLSQGNPVTLVIVLLKIILVSKNSRTHLEGRIAELIRYYQNYPEDECAWVVNFLEVFNVTFTIHAENVQYNLVRMDSQGSDLPPIQFDPDTYRIFSQLKEVSWLSEQQDSLDLAITDDNELPPEDPQAL
ncbi:MAG: hypothetical protein VKJ24_06220, partial [Synechococcales bacterium]|nr:hypothetical protein [Synechococcales bacterium]